jgi:hypothetical protein
MIDLVYSIFEVKQELGDAVPYLHCVQRVLNVKT